VQIYLAAVRNAFLQNECAQVENSLQPQIICIFAVLMWLFRRRIERKPKLMASVGICYSPPHPPPPNLSRLPKCPSSALPLSYSLFSEGRRLPFLADGRGVEPNPVIGPRVWFSLTPSTIYLLPIVLYSKANFLFC
jgi:hypothetical protein